MKLEMLFTDANVDLVSAGIDLAICLGPPLTGDVVTSRLFPTSYKVVASPGYRRNASTISRPEDLAEHACTLFALPEFQSEWRFRLRTKRSHGEVIAVPPGIGTVVSSALSLRSVVLGGSGPALLADWLISADVSAGRLVDILPNYEATATTFETAAWIVYPSRAYLPQKVRVMIEFLTKRLGPV